MLMVMVVLISLVLAPMLFVSLSLLLNQMAMIPSMVALVAIL